MSRQFSKKDIWRLQKDTWKLNYIIGLMKCKILHFTYKTILKESVCTSHSSIPLCLKLHLPLIYPQTATGQEDHKKIVQ